MSSSWVLLEMIITNASLIFNSLLTTRVMGFVRFLAILILTVKSNILFEQGLEAGSAVNASQLISERNCSQYEPDPNFDFREFAGNWKFDKYFSSEFALPECMTLDSRIQDTKIFINVSRHTNHNHLPESDYAESISLVGYVDMNKDREDIPGLWSLYSNLSLAPSKLIVLSGSRRRVLYLICGDFPDQSSRVGEIGILSRDSGLSIQEGRALQEILANYALHITLQDLSQNYCDMP